MKVYYSPTKVRLKKLYQADSSLNLIIIPGDPGLGSEYLLDFASSCMANFNIWLVDFPGCGNYLKFEKTNYSQYTSYIMEAAQYIEGEKIFMGHSYGAMLLMNSSEVSSIADAIILMSATSMDMVKQEIDAAMFYRDLKSLVFSYQLSPSDESFKNMVISLCSNFFSYKTSGKGTRMISNNSFSHKSFDYFINDFFRNYTIRYKFDLPTLIIGGEKDEITPISLFKKSHQFSLDNIQIKEVRGAFHYPWIENPRETRKNIVEFVNSI
ncbi:MAG: alpha/beta fold hydrolase [Bacteroidales bacterium]